MQGGLTYEKILNNFPIKAQEAWEKAKEEAGIGGFGEEEEGDTLFLSEFAKWYLIAGMKGYSDDTLGSTVESILEIAKEIQERLNDSHHPVFHSEWQESTDKEKEFYQKFIEYLEA